MKNKKTFAQRAAEIERKFKDRNDNVSLRTKKALMQELREEQEAVKAAMETPDTNQAFLGALFGAAGGAGAAAGAAGGLGAAARPALTSVMDPGLVSKGLTPLSGGAELTAGAVPTAKAPSGGGAGGAVSGALGLIPDAMKAFSKSDVDTTGETRVDPGAIKKANTTGLITGLVGAGGKAASGDFLGAGMDILKTGLGAIGGRKDKIAAYEGLKNNDLKANFEAGPSSYNSAYGGVLPQTRGGMQPLPLKVLANGGETDPVVGVTAGVPEGPKPKWTPMPTDIDPQVQNDKRTAWAVQQRMSAPQLGSFEDQRTDIQTTNANREALYAQKWNEWRSGRTGATPHNKYSMADPVYGQAKQRIQQDVYKAFPRTVNAGVQEYAQERSQMAYGGKLNQYGPGGWLFGKTQETEDGEMKSRAGNALDWLGKNSGNIAQYANVLGPLTQKFNKAETPRGSRHIGQTTLGRLDEESIANKLRGSVDVGGSARETSGGSLSSYKTGTQVGNKQLLDAIGDTYFKTKQSNLGQEAAEEQMNLQQRSQNIALDDKWLERKALDEGAYQSAKQANRAAIFDNVSAIGREESNKKVVKEMYGYKWDGTYVRDAKGNIVTDKKGNPITKEAYEAALPTPTGKKKE